MDAVTQMVKVITGEPAPPPPKKYILTLDEQNAAFVLAMLGMTGQDYATRTVHQSRSDVTVIPHSKSVWRQFYDQVKHDSRFMSLVREFGIAETQRRKGVKL